MMPRVSSVASDRKTVGKEIEQASLIRVVLVTG
jgi:hypothetical protein